MTLIDQIKGVMVKLRSGYSQAVLSRAVLHLSNLSVGIIDFCMA